MEVRCDAGRDNHAAGRIGIDLAAIELLTEADIKNTRNYRVDPVLWMLVRHEFCAARHLYSDDIRSQLIGLSYKDGQPGFRREGRERPPGDFFRQVRPEMGFSGLVRWYH